MLGAQYVTNSELPTLSKLLQAVSSDRSLNYQKYKIAVDAMEQTV